MGTSSKTSLMSLGELIETAFDDPHTNTVRHKYIETILVILARQLKLLGRQLDIDIGYTVETPESSLSVTEVKVHVVEKQNEPEETEVNEQATEPREVQTAQKSQKKKPVSNVRKAKTSQDAVETTFEKILVVERVPSEEARAEATNGQRDVGVPGEMVTQERYQELASTVRQLQEKFGLSGSPPDAELEKLIRKEGAKLCEGMAGMQLSARLEEAEKLAEQMLPVLSKLATEAGIDINAPLPVDMRLILGTANREENNEMDEKLIETFSLRKKTKDVSESSKSPRSPKSPKGKKEPGSASISTASIALSLPPPPSSEDIYDEPLVEAPSVPDEVEAIKSGITDRELQDATNELYNEIMKQVTTTTTRTDKNADTALKMTTKIQRKIDISLNVGDTMADVEDLVRKYTEKINIIDTYLSTEMTTNQEELTQMQHYVEVGLETMTEMLINTGCDPALICELNIHFNNLQSDLDNAMTKQMDLNSTQNLFSSDLKSLKDDIDRLTRNKASRDEVADFLRDKVGIGALNGVTSRVQFASVKGDFEKRIGESYDIFNGQEMSWQKYLDDCEKNFNDKVDIIQLNDLQDQINHYKALQKEKVKFIESILGEPEAGEKWARSMLRDGSCIACSTPVPKKKGNTPSLTEEHETSKKTTMKEQKITNDGKVKCYAGYPIPHPIDPRSNVCRRWCGGSHTKISNTTSRVPPGILLKSYSRKLNKEMGADGKMYAVDETNIPCSQCNMLFRDTITPASSEVLQGEVNKTDNSGLDMDNDKDLKPLNMSTNSTPTHFQEDIDEQEREAIEDH